MPAPVITRATATSGTEPTMSASAITLIAADAAGQDGPAGFDPMDAAALVIAASDGLQIQWLLDPDAVDVGRSLALLDRLLPGNPRPEVV